MNIEIHKDQDGQEYFLNTRRVNGRKLYSIDNKKFTPDAKALVASLAQRPRASRKV